MTCEHNHTRGKMVTHISDDRFREIVLSASRADAAPAVLSIKESEHFHNCEACIDRLGDIARQIFKECLAGPTEIGSVSGEDGSGDTESSTTSEGQS
jgi:hypothetical protein